MSTLAVTNAGLLAICAVVGVCLSTATLVYGWVRDRQKERAEIRIEAIGQAGKNKTRLDDLYVSMVGRPADDESGLPAVEGFVQMTNRRLTALEQAK